MTTVRSQRLPLRPQIRRRRDGRSGLAFQVEKVDVLANALANRRVAVKRELLAQKGDGLGTLAAGGQHLGVDFDRGAERGGQPGVRIELAAAQKIERELAGFGGELVGAVEFAGIER